MRLEYPKFTKGRILKIDMLEDLRDYSRDTLDILTSRLSDGIVEGFYPEVFENTIEFSKGIVKYNRQIYLINKKLSIDYEATEVDVLIKLVFLDERQETDYNVQDIEIVLDRNTEILENEIELGRFKLKAGAYLRADYKDLDDYTTEFNTINFINVKYASIEEHTLTPTFMGIYGKEILKVNPKDCWDINFGLICINSEKITREAIISYINNRLSEENVELGNYELHKKLILVLEKVRKENHFVTNNKRERKMIIVD